MPNSLPSEAPRLDDPEFEKLIDELRYAAYWCDEPATEYRKEVTDDDVIAAKAALRARVAQLVSEVWKEARETKTCERCHGVGEFKSTLSGDITRCEDCTGRGYSYVR
jgi:hypothetical protein